MSQNILTFALDGEITLAEYSEAMKRFRSFVGALSQEVGRNTKIDWRIDELQAGNAIAMIHGNSAHPDIVDSVVHAYARVGTALERGEPIPYSDIVRRRAYHIQKLVKGSINSIRFETPFSDALIARGSRRDDGTELISAHQTDKATIKKSHGQIRGTVQTLTNRGGLKFTLYDSIFDSPISCYLSEGQEEIMRGLWGRKVIVSGIIGREPYQQRVVERKIDALWNDDSVINLIELHDGIALHARELMRRALTQNWSLKPADAIHLASAQWLRVTEIHTL
jgi:hypothetical protein